jgi:hypothetical protein
MDHFAVLLVALNLDFSLEVLDPIVTPVPLFPVLVLASFPIHKLFLILTRQHRTHSQS